MNRRVFPPLFLGLGVALALVKPGETCAQGSQLAMVRRAESLSRAQEWPAAAALWQRVVDVNPHLGSGWQQLGTARYQTKNYRAALSAFTRVLELRSGYPFNAAYNVARCHAMLGEKQEALAWLQKSLDLGLRSLQRVRTDEDLKSLRGDERFKKMAAVVDVGCLSRVEGWRFDLDLLAREIRRAHYAPFRKVSRERFDAAVEELRRQIPQLSDNQIAVGFRKLLRLVGDGHTSLAGTHRGQALKNRAPVAFYCFAEGVFITEADPRFAALAGSRVLAVGGHPVDECLRALDTVVSQDNSMGLLCNGPRFLRVATVLHGLGLIPDDKSLPLTIVDAEGRQREVALPADAGEVEPSWISARKDAALPAPLYLKKERDPYWFEYLPDKKLVYCQYNQVYDEGQKESIEKFSARLFRFIADHDVRALVVDVRWNGGGNNFLNEPLVIGLIHCEKINQSGRLFVIVGRQTFSAAMCFVAQVDWHTKAVFVGEPTGSSPNFVGESAVIVEMPYSKLRASISDLYWENSVAMDYRTWIAPEIFAPPTFAAFRANRDPALEAIAAYRAENDGAEVARGSYRISTVAGNGEAGFAGDGGPATQAKLQRPCAVAIDRQGNLYIADYSNHRIRQVTSDGLIKTLAGTGEPGYARDGGPAIKARLKGPYAVCVDERGNVYVADQQNNRIRKISLDGAITTVAGNGERRFAGDGGPAAAASLVGPDAVVVDKEGILYIADSGNHRIRKVTGRGIITTIAGSEKGYSGDGGPAIQARLNLPAALALDAEGSLYVGDFHNHVVRKITRDGIISTVAGTGSLGFNGDGIGARQAKLHEPGGVAVAPDGSLIIADGVNFRVRRVGSDGIIHTIAGSGQRGFSGDGGPATEAKLSVLDILTVDASGNIYVADHGNHRIRKLVPASAR